MWRKFPFLAVIPSGTSMFGRICKSDGSITNVPLITRDSWTREFNAGCQVPNYL